MRLVEVGDLELRVHDMESADPVVLVQTALTADEWAPLAEEIADRGAYRAIIHHRRGYGSSSPAHVPGSVVRDAADCRDLIVALGLGKVHIVGCPKPVTRLATAILEKSMAVVPAEA